MTLEDPAKLPAASATLGSGRRPPRIVEGQVISFSSAGMVPAFVSRNVDPDGASGMAFSLE
jgi:hypothetical protein